MTSDITREEGGETLTDHERRVLEALDGGWEEYCYGFRYLEATSGLDRDVVRAACRSLTDKGLAHWAPGLMDEDGRAAGSGYGLTRAGNELNKRRFSKAQPHD